jgi:hypothetical protein
MLRSLKSSAGAGQCTPNANGRWSPKTDLAPEGLSFRTHGRCESWSRKHLRGVAF